VVRAWALAFAAAGVLWAGAARGERVVVLGDSLSAEYAWMPDYGLETVEGWRARSWVEILAELRPDRFAFGAYRELPSVWDPWRAHGFKRNWAFPGAEAEDIENRVLDPFDPFRLLLGPELDRQIAAVDCVVIFLGANDFREVYGGLYDGADAAPLIAEVERSVTRLLDHVLAVHPRARVVVVNVPDPGASPSKAAAHPGAEGRARVTAAIREVNRRLYRAAALRGVAWANVYRETKRLMRGDVFRWGSVEFRNAADPDNDPLALFARDGLHPNTALQARNAQAVIDALNLRYGAGIPRLTDAEVLGLLGL
jgi:lysophospholipase L1-like esterase